MKKILTFIKNIFRKHWPIILVVVAAILSARTLFLHNFYFNMHDDLQMMRQLELEKCFNDGQIPCRWVPDMGYGFGFPLFNYYPQLPYLVGEIFRIFALPFNDVAKLNFAVGIVASGLTMYFLAKEFFGRAGGVISAIFYIWAPYRAVDVYVRGALNESWAWIFFPLILLFSYRIVKNVRKKLAPAIVGLSLAITGLLLTHNLMVMIFVPVGAVWVIFWIIKFRSFRTIMGLAISGIISVGLSAFFTLPAIFEQKYVHIETVTSDYFQYFAHFATLKQLFLSTFWGDGPSIFGPNDGLAFPVGQVHWILTAVLILFLVIGLIRKRKWSDAYWVTVFAIAVGTAAAFMAHEKSSFIWKIVPVLKFVQFPWRFLTLSVLGYSLAAGGAATLFPGKYSKLIIAAGCILVIILNWNFFRPVNSGFLTDGQKFSGEAWRIQQQAGIRDYLPLTAKDDPEFARTVLAEGVQGNPKISGAASGTNWAEFSLVGDVQSVVRINIFDYPEWKAYVDGKETGIFTYPGEIWGRIYISVPEGSHNVYLKLQNTPLRTGSNLISLIFWAGLAIFTIWRGKMVQFKRE